MADHRSEPRVLFIQPSKNAFGVLGRRKKLCGDDTGNDKRETYKFCIVKKNGMPIFPSRSSGIPTPCRRCERVPPFILRNLAIISIIPSSCGTSPYRYIPSSYRSLAISIIPLSGNRQGFAPLAGFIALKLSRVKRRSCEVASSALEFSYIIDGYDGESKRIDNPDRDGAPTD